MATEEVPQGTGLHGEKVEQSGYTTFWYYVRVSVYILILFTSSSAITLLIKYTVSYTRYKYPLTLLSIQMLMSGSISVLILASYAAKRVTSGGPFFWASLSLLKKFGLVGVLTGIDYGLSNMSFRFVSVSLYTMIKSAVPLFVLLIALGLKLERPKLNLILAIFAISVGVLLTVLGAVDVDLFGCSLVFVATICTGARLTLVQYVLQVHDRQSIVKAQDVELESVENEQAPPTEKQEEEIQEHEPQQEQENTRHQEYANLTEIRLHKEEEEEEATVAEGDTLLGGSKYTTGITDKESDLTKALRSQISSVILFTYIAPLVSVTVLPFAAVLEFPSIFNDVTGLARVDHPLQALGNYFAIAILLMFITSLCGLILNVSEYLLIKETSSLTLTVLGICKELVLIGSSVLLFGDQLTDINIVGYIIALIGIVIYKYHRLVSMNQVVSVVQLKVEH